MRKTGREVTRKNQKTDETRIARMSPLGTTEKPRTVTGWILTVELTRTPYNGTQRRRAAGPTPEQRGAHLLPASAHSSSRL